MANQKYYEEHLNDENYDFLVELEKSGKYSWEDIEEKVDIEDKKIVWKGNLDIRKTSIKKIKAKKIEGNIKAFDVESLKEIEVEEIGGNLNIIGTSVENIKAKKIKGNIDAYGVDMLKEIEIEEIGGCLYIENSKIEKIKVKSIKGGLYAEGAFNLKEIEVEEEILSFLDIERTTKDFQLKIIEEINKGELKVRGNIYFGGDIEEIERLCENKNLVIPGHLDIGETKVKKVKVKRIGGNLYAEKLESLEEIEVEDEIGGDLYIKGTNTDFQLKIIEKIRNGKLKVIGEVYYDNFKSLNKWKLD